MDKPKKGLSAYPPERNRSVSPKKPAGKTSAPRNSGSTAIITGLFFLFALIYMGSMVYGLASKSKTAITTLSIGSINTPSVHDGVIVRDETVYTSGFDGYLSFNIRNYDRVKKNSTVCNVKNSELIGAAEKDLYEINQEILNLQNTRLDFSIYSEDIKKINRSIKDYIDLSSFKLAQDSFGDAYKIKANIKLSIDERNNKLLSENRGSVTELNNKKATNEDIVSANSSTVISVESGIVVYDFDGQEDILTVDSLDSIIKEQTHMTTKMESAPTNKSLEKGDPLFRLIRSNIWYIAAYIPSEKIMGYSVGKEVKIYVKGGGQDFGELIATISILNQSYEETYVVYKLTRSMLDYADTRSVQFKLEESIHSGFKLPKTAIVEKTLIKLPVGYVNADKNTVQRLIGKDIDTNELITESITVKVFKKSELFVYVALDFNSIKLGDTLVPVHANTAPGYDDEAEAESETGNEAEAIVDSSKKSETYQAQETINVKGVYVVNTSYAEFKTIHIDDNAPENDGYIILNPALNSDLAEYDRIVADAQSVKEGDRVY